MYFWGGGTPRGFMGAFPEKESGVEVLSGLALSSQIVGSLLKTPRANVIKLFTVVSYDFL
jgi:hypothetical protein